MSEWADPIHWIKPSRKSDPAIILSGGSITYKELFDLVDSAARILEEKGFAENDRVLLRAGIEFADIIMLLACFKADIVPCLIHPKTPDVQAKRLGTLCRCCAEVQAVEIGGEVIPTVVPLERIESPCPIAESSVVVFTSGSSGEPKAAILSQRALRHNAALANQNIPVVPGDRWLFTLPLCHVSGLGIIFRCLTSGAAVVVSDRSGSIEEQLVKSKISHISVVPTQLYRVLLQTTAFPKEMLSRLKCVLVGGAPIPENLIRDAVQAGFPIYMTYGLTEMGSQVTTTAEGEALSALGTCGHPLEPESVTIDKNGEILVRGNSLFSGYFQSEGVHLPLNEDGWFATRDLGCWDQSGRLCYRGRKDLLFRCKGEFVSPEEIEHEIVQIEGIEQVVVVPREDPEYGKCPVGLLKLMESQRSNWEKIIARVDDHLKACLPSHKRPRAYLPLPEKQSRGFKINRKELEAYVDQILSAGDSDSAV